ncbi:hypothetical protein SELMODRAFT_86718 [Selaginella moellendorffii]|uniref:Xyloglucan endotransglucosylase/hydrolase n=1 Tax=Selaginella moellendorffii TaxID=88036 RepID=D8R808_SELML|nr:probable xyloglucan endotransglucosylase/hydrolase protein 8 [Selaginella moellendorffii]EFJ31972.1 hypothetical protein SELMODRAFT_86718 [Selaginella moellendorffii]|eukprot:XP_002967373.1 probable xyloglucan endotransglucosylase/hydrolase protein 8 [Selaginella moellendorffii]
MERLFVAGFVLLLAVSFAQAKQRPPTFDENFSVMWADDHVQTTGENGSLVQLMLDSNSGSAFSTIKKYLFGFISMNLKLVPGDSAGVVTAYYLSSETDNRDELDFEFLGNRSGQPYTLQTNVYSNGKGEREQRLMLWFDPSQDFHAYSFLWNKHHIVFYVDKTPVRVHRLTSATQDVFPSKQPMRLISSIWNADGWATRGGKEKIDWSGAPFVASYAEFAVDGCDEGDAACLANTSSHWWDGPSSWELSVQEEQALGVVRSKFLIYDYCLDTNRNPSPPTECSVNPK